MSDHASSNVQASMRSNEGEWVREELSEIENKLTEIVDDNINNALEEMRMMMERMMRKKDKHNEGLNKERKHLRTFITKEKKGGVIILVIV